MLARQRHVHNLIGTGDLEQHFEDCGRALSWLAPAGRWADLGSGAGFPGLVMLARHPALQIDLVDSRQKRCAFLEQVLIAGDADRDRARVLCTRVEALESGQYDGVVSRAFAPPPLVIQHAARLVAVDGTLVMMLQADGVVPRTRHFEVFHVERYAVRNRPRQAVGLRRLAAPADPEEDPNTAS